MKLKKKLILGLTLATPMLAVSVMAAKCAPGNKTERAEKNLKKAQERLEKAKQEELKQKGNANGQPRTPTTPTTN